LLVFTLQQVVDKRLDTVQASIAQDIQRSNTAPSALSVHDPELEQKIEESSENHRFDFLSLNEKIDQLIQHQKIETAKIKEEMNKKIPCGIAVC
jgi:hypothetical protein